jgi:hypothetical protein
MFPDAGGRNHADHMVFSLEDRTSADKSDTGKDPLSHPGLAAGAVNGGYAYQRESAGHDRDQWKGAEPEPLFAHQPVETDGKRQSMSDEHTGAVGPDLEPIDRKQVFHRHDADLLSFLFSANQTDHLLHTLRPDTKR